MRIEETCRTRASGGAIATQSETEYNVFSPSPATRLEARSALVAYIITVDA